MAALLPRGVRETEAQDGGIDSLILGIRGAGLGVDVVGIEETKSLVDKQRGVGAEPLTNHLIGKRVGVILADAAHLGVLLDEFFQAPFVFQELGEVLVRAHFPGHVASGPKACVAIVQCLIESTCKGVHHLGNVKLSLDQVILLGGHDQAAFFCFVRDIDSGGSEVGPHAGNHGAAIEVEAPMILFELIEYDRSHRREMPRGSALIDEAMMARGSWFHH